MPNFQTIFAFLAAALADWAPRCSRPVAQTDVRYEAENRCRVRFRPRQSLVPMRAASAFGCPAISYALSRAPLRRSVMCARSL